MNTDKFFEDLVTNDEVKDIPIGFICRVAITVLELLNTGKYNYKIGE